MFRKHSKTLLGIMFVDFLLCCICFFFFAVENGKKLNTFCKNLESLNGIDNIFLLNILLYCCIRFMNKKSDLEIIFFCVKRKKTEHCFCKTSKLNIAVPIRLLRFTCPKHTCKLCTALYIVQRNCSRWYVLYLVLAT
jgi:hypothetical protein